MRHRLSKGKAEKLGVALFVVLIETASILLDAFINGWKPSVAGLCLSLLTASFTHLLTFLLHRKNIFDVSVFIPLSFAIVALAFAFYEEKKVIDWPSGDLSTEDFISRYDYWNSTPWENDLLEVKTVNDSNSTNTLLSKFRPRQVTGGGPRIQNLQITGEARLGEKLFGHAELVTGTSSCTFQWVRESSPSGHRQLIEGATEQFYVVTVDDVDKLIALECIPMDDQAHQGEPVRVFANGNSKIECDRNWQGTLNTFFFKMSRFYTSTKHI